MKALFAALDAHAAIYWLGAAGAWALWIGREGRTDDGGRARGWRDAALMFLVLLAWRWPRLLQAWGGPIAEAQCVADGLAIGLPAPEAGGTLLGGSSVMAALALLPTHLAGVPMDFFNARLTALLMDAVSLAGCAVLLERSARRECASVGLTGLLALAAVCDSPLFHAYSSWHLAVLLTIAGLVGGRAASARADIGGEASAFGAGTAAGVLAWLGWSGLAGATVVLASFAGGARRHGWARSRWLGSGVLFGLATELALRRGLGAWGLSGVAWSEMREWWGGGRDAWVGAALLAASAAALWSVARIGARGRRGGVWALAAVALVLGGWRGVPPPMGDLLQHWRAPCGTIAQVLAKWRVQNERLLVLGAAPHLAVELGEPAGIARGVWHSDADGAEMRRRVVERLRSRPGVYAIVLPDRMTMVDAFRDLAEDVRNRYRLVRADGTLRVYVPAERHWETTRAGRAVWPLTPADFVLPDSGGAANALTPEGNLLTHAPARLIHPVPRGARELVGAFGFYAGAFLKPESGTDGATFKVTWILGDGRRIPVVERRLDPRVAVADRDLVPMQLAVPAEEDPIQVELAVEAGANNQFDWTYWVELRFTGRD